MLALSEMMLAVLLTGCAVKTLPACPQPRQVPAALFEKKTPVFEAWSQKVSNDFSKVEKAGETPQQARMP